MQIVTHCSFDIDVNWSDEENRRQFDQFEAFIDKIGGKIEDDDGYLNSDFDPSDFCCLKQLHKNLPLVLRLPSPYFLQRSENGDGGYNCEVNRIEFRDEGDLSKFIASCGYSADGLKKTAA